MSSIYENILAAEAEKKRNQKMDKLASGYANRELIDIDRVTRDLEN